MNGMPAKDGPMPHFSAFRPVNAPSTSSKFLNPIIDVEMYTPKEQETISSQHAVSESSVSTDLGYKVKYHTCYM